MSVLGNDASAQDNTNAPAANAGNEQAGQAPASADGNAAGEKTPEAKTDKVEGAPEKYEFSTPEGVTIEEGLLGKFTGLAKELNLPQATAQKFIDLATEHVGLLTSKQGEQWDKVRSEWVSSIKADKEFGGGAFGETCDRAKRALKRFGSDEMVSFLDSTGYGDNPEVIKLLARVDRATSEDRMVDGTPSSYANKSAAEILYGNHK